jgi:putative transposase
LIAVEDLNINGMAAGLFAKGIHDVGWSQWFSFTDYKAESAGRQFVRKNPYRTSQECTCGASVPKTIGQRWHLCTGCGLSLPRDHVSALVILDRPLNGASVANVGVVMPRVDREAVCFS